MVCPFFASSWFNISILLMRTDATCEWKHCVEFFFLGPYVQFSTVGSVIALNEILKLVLSPLF